MKFFLSLYPLRSFYGSPPTSLTLTCGKMSLVQEAVFCVPGWRKVRLISTAMWIFLGNASLGLVNGTLSTWKGVIGVVFILGCASILRCLNIHCEEVPIVRIIICSFKLEGLPILFEERLC